MKVYIYTQSPKEFYYLGIKYLKGTGEIDSYELIDIKAFRKLVKNVLISLGFLKHKQKDQISLKELWARALAPFTLLFRENIILGIEPYDWIVIYGLVLKALGKNIVYYTSWPYWTSGDQPKKAILGSKIWWRYFLRGLKVVSVNNRGFSEMKRFNAQVYHITHPVDTKRFFPRSKGAGNERIKILSVSRLEEKKGIRGLMEIAESKALGEAEIIICGQGSMEKEIIEKSKTLDNLTYVSYDEQSLPDIYRMADIFVLNSYKVPGWEELFGMVLLEAMASGLPVVATDCIGPKEIISDGEFGYTVPQKDSPSLVSKLKLLSTNKSLREDMGKRARKEAETTYKLNNIASKWLSVLKN